MANPKSWQGDWYQRISDGLAKHGATSVMDFAAQHPTWTYRQLAEELGAGIAPIQVQWVERDEAIKSGRFGDFARSNLVRSLRECMPEGWGKGENPPFRVSQGLGVWSASLGEGYSEIVARVSKALKATAVPSGWLPDGPSDPLIVAALDRIEFKSPIPNV